MKGNPHKHRSREIFTMAGGYEPLDLHQRGDVCYVLKKHAPKKNRHSKGRSSHEVKDEVFNSARLQRTMQEVAMETGREVKEVEREVQFLLEEIGHKFALPAVRTLAFVLRMALRRVLRGIYVNREGVERLRGLVEQWPVVLLPSHRSYLDFILVSFVMYHYGIQLPCIAAGQDFMSMKLVSSFLRRSGAFFLRRTFSSDKLYKAVFAGYVQALLSSGDAPLEFFIDGTRSRTAKSLHPKLGLMSMVVEPYLAGWLPDIMMVPISISYERTLEEQLFARELLGVPKPKESTRGLLRATSILSEDYGSILINIGSPISLHDVCLSHGVSRVPRSVFPKDATLVLPKERQLILKLGHMIVEHTNQGMRVFPSAMVATLVLQTPGGVARSDLVQKMEWLRKEITRHGGTVYWEGDADSAVASGLRMLYTSLEVTEDNVVRPQGGHLHSELSCFPRKQRRIEEVVKMELNRTDLDLITEISFIHLLLAHYRNQLLHLFVPEAMLALCLHRDAPTDIDTALRKFEVLHCALAREFVLPLKSPRELFSEALQSLLDRGVLQCHEQGWAVLNGYLEETIVFLRNLILPFVAGIWVVCQHLISFAGGVQSLNTTIKGAQQLAAKCIQAGLLSHYEILSLEMVKNALASLTLVELIRQPSSEVEGRDRLVKVAEEDKLLHLAKELGTVIFIDQKHLWIAAPTAKL